MLRENRIKQIMNLLIKDGEVRINHLCHLFSVTEMTIRRDLDEMAAKEMLVRTHGGAIPIGDNSLTELPFDKRFNKNTSSKLAIAAKAVEMVENGMKLVIDSGSTAFCLAQLIPTAYRLAILTNAVNIASELILRSNVDLTLIGGDMRKDTLATVGFYTNDMIKGYSVDIAFLGASGAGMDMAFYSSSTTVSEVKRSMLKIAKKRVLLIDSTKFQASDFSIFAYASDFDVIITDSLAPQEVITAIQNSGTQVVISSI